MKYRILLAMLLCGSPGWTHAGPPASWPFIPWAEALKIADAEHKPLFVLFGYDECEWCQVLYRRGMNDDEVLAKYSATVVMTYVDTKNTSVSTKFQMPDGSEKTFRELIQLYRVYPVPSWVYLSETGVLLNSDRSGRTTSRELLKDLEVAMSKRSVGILAPEPQ